MKIMINLLPGAAQSKKRRELMKMLSIIVTLFTVSFGALAVFTFIVFSQKLLVDNKINTLNEENTSIQGNIHEYDELIENTELLKNKITAINTILGNMTSWDEFLTSFSGSLPTNGIKIINTNISKGEMTMSFTGIADSSAVIFFTDKAIREANRPVSYEVLPSDTLNKIALSYGVSEDLILRINNASNEEDLLGRTEISVPILLFSDVTHSPPIASGDDSDDPQVERDLTFTYNVVLTPEALQ